MSGLLLILTEAGGERCSAAVELAAVCAAMDRPVAVLLRGQAAGALHAPAITAALKLLIELGAEINLCQTAMADHGLDAEDLPPGVEPLGMMAFMEGRGGWQIVLA